MTGPRVDRSQPRHDVLAVKVVLDDGGEPFGAVLVGDLDRESVTEVEVPTGLMWGLLVVMNPPAYRPTIELAPAHVNAPIKLTGQQVGDRRLASGLHAHDEPDLPIHWTILAH